MIDAGSTELNNAWKNVLHNQAEDYIIPESNVNVMCPYDTTDLSGYTVYGYSSNTLCDLSVLARNNTVINRDRKLATFEWNFWVLDGSFEVLDTNEQIKGFASYNLSGENGAFNGTNPYVYFDTENGVSLNKKQTLKFAPSYSEVPSEVTIFSQNGSTVNNTVTFDIESQLETDNLQEREYVHLYSDSIDDEITDARLGIVFNKTLMPYRRARLTEYNNGYYFYLDKYDLQTFSHSRTLSLCMEELPQNDLEVSFVDIEGIFDSQRNDAPFHITFDKNHRFYIYVGYDFENIGWNYVKIDTLCLDEFEIDRNSIETRLKLQSTLQLYTGKYDTSKIDWKTQSPQTAPYNWTTFKGFLTAIKTQLGISGFTYLPDDTSIPNLNAPLSKWQYYLYYSYRQEQEFNKIQFNELIQQICSMLRCALVRQPDEALNIQFLYTDYVRVEDAIPTANIISYPTKINGERFKYVEIDTPKTSNDQNDDEDVHTTEGGLDRYYLKSRNKFTIDDETVEETATLTQKVAPLSFANGHSDCWSWNATIWQNWATHYWLIKKSTRYEFGEVFFNPLLQVGDVLRVYIGENYNEYLGRIEKIEINYDGSFKGAITLCSFGTEG